MSEYCQQWGLQVNTAKTKIVIFWKNKRGLRNMPRFHFNDNNLEFVDSFSYLGVKFSYNGKFNDTKKYLIGQARKAMYSVINKARKLSLPIDMQLSLFDSMIAPILMYGSEVWGIENVEVIDRFQLKFCKLVLNLKQTTPNCMIYGELGILPTSIHIKSRILNYWCSVIMSKHSKISNILYRTMFKLYTVDGVNISWINFVHTTLDSLGLSNMWLDQNVNSPNTFRSLVNCRLRDQFIQNWHSTLDNTSKCLNYRIYKQEFAIENYFHILSPDLANILCKFRSVNHKLPIEKGRYQNIERNLRTCNLCSVNVLGDEFHYIFQCSHFNTIRKKFIDAYYLNNPNTVKYCQLMNSNDKSTLLKLSLFCKNIMSAFH